MKKYCGEDTGRRVVDWLNGVEPKMYSMRLLKREKNSKASRARIRDLVAAVQELQAWLKGHHEYRDQFREGETRIPKVEALEDEINSRLAEYPSTASILIEDGGYIFADEFVSGSRPIGESVAAHGIVKLIQMRLNDRICLCLCGKYFFAKLPTQGFCSAKCRHKEYEQTEAFKAQRREYMRKYYKLKTSGKVK